VTVSNLASNIVLSLEKSGTNIVLSWNPYKNWLGTISSYKLFINSGKGFEEKDVIPASDTVFVQGYQQIMYEVSGNEVCFYISASETANPYGISGESISSTICTSPTEVITVPNVFTPNNDLDNDLFRPVLSFTPLEYHLIISDRQGNMLFETRDYLAEWDGTQNGKPQPQGVYLWFLKLTTPSGKVISKTGTITIIRSR
jgi:gliding motility-associated-like protein